MFLYLYPKPKFKLKRWRHVVIGEDSQGAIAEFMSVCVVASDSGTVIDLHRVTKELPCREEH